MSDDTTVNERILIGKSEIFTEAPPGFIKSIDGKGQLIQSPVENHIDIEMSNGLFVRTARDISPIIRIVQKNGRVWTLGDKWPPPYPDYKFNGGAEGVGAWQFEVGYLFYDAPRARFVVFAFPKGSMIESDGMVRAPQLESPDTTGLWRYTKLFQMAFPRAIVRSRAVDSWEEAFPISELQDARNLLQRETFEQFLDEIGDVPRDKPGSVEVTEDEEEEEEDDTTECPNEACEEASIPADAKFCQTCGTKLPGLPAVELPE